MNLFKKIYCRLFQMGFHIALPIMPYREPKLLEGMESIPQLLKIQGRDKVLLVTDRGIRSLGLTDRLEALLKDNDIKCTVYDKTVANPTTDNVEEARLLYLNNGCNAMIAFGGGSSMDCAKAAGARIVKPKQSLSKMGGILKIHKKLPMLIAIPTTAGTGSETTVAAVITDSETRHKYGINDFCLIPAYAVLEPEITYGLPKHITSTTGIDALTHAVEAYIGRSTNRQTRAASTEAVKLIFDNLKTAYDMPTNEAARKNMLRASYLAGTAFTKSYVGYVHAVAHSLGGKYGIAHGLANSVLLPYFLEAYGKSIHKKLWKLAVASGAADMEDSYEAGARKFIAKIVTLNEAMGIPKSLAGIREEDIDELAKYADKEGNPLYPVPVLMNAKELKRFYQLVMEESKDGQTAN